MSWLQRPAPAQRLADPEPIPARDASSAVVDEFLESYVFWRESCEALSAAYQDWDRCESLGRRLAFESYRAALDWEELAAQLHAHRTARVRAMQG